MGNDESLLKQQLANLEQQLQEKNLAVSALEQANKRLEDRVKETEGQQQSATAPNELEETLKRVVTRISMILQAEKCVYMLFDDESGELRSQRPAFGLADEEVKTFRVRATEGVSGEVFRDQKPIILYDAMNDPRTISENVGLLNIVNGVCVPLVIEKRDEDTNKVLERRIIGVMWVFNKRYGNVFIQEDVNLLTRLSSNAAAVIASAYAFRKIEEEKEELEHVIESVYAGLIIVHNSGRLMQMNQSARKMLGIKSDERLVGDYHEIIGNEKILEILNKTMDECTELQEEATLPDFDSDEEGAERIFQAQTAVVKGEDQNSIGVVAIFNDITEIRSIEKMKTAFVSTVSHELRTPLTSIKGFISTLLQDTEGFYDAATIHEFYTIIDQECDRLTRLISDLLNVSRIEAGRALDLNPVSVNVPEIVDKVVAAQKSYTTNHQFKVELDANIPSIVADKDKIDQILTNLTNNAVKYSPNGGLIKVIGKVLDSHIRITVSDQGMGIPKEHLSKVFERFHRIDNRDTRKVGGTGIGLYLVKHLVEAHGGTIWVESDQGKGSEFIFDLPFCPPQFEAEFAQLSTSDYKSEQPGMRPTDLPDAE